MFQYLQSSTTLEWNFVYPVKWRSTLLKAADDEDISKLRGDEESGTERVISCMLFYGWVH